MNSRITSHKNDKKKKKYNLYEGKATILYNFFIYTSLNPNRATKNHEENFFGYEFM